MAPGNPRHQPTPTTGQHSRPSTREQASRIERDYYHRTSPLAGTRRWLVLTALFAGVGWCAWAAVDARRHVSPGPLTAVHATWDHDCNACHAPFTPIVDATFLSGEHSRAVGDAKCLPCHRVAGHHEREIAAEVGSCGSCHSDHRGRSADITRVSDRTCTSCHSDLAAHRTVAADTPPLSPEAVWRIEGFDNRRHPPFASLREDPGTLIFTHGRHMLPGQYLGAAPADADTASPAGAQPRSRALTYADLPEADRARYLPADTPSNAPVQLSCVSCHEFGTNLAATDLRQVGGLSAGASPGAYALPVDFQRHCAACHPLPFEGLPAGAAPGTAAGLQDGADVDAVIASVGTATAVVPHGLNAAALRRFLEQTYLARGVAGDPAALLEPVVQQPLPATADNAPQAVTVSATIDEKVAGARRFVRGQCAKCHMLEDVSVDAGTPPWFRTLPTRVPEVWLTKARFDHQAHRQYECRVCHESAYPNQAAALAAAQGDAAAHGGPAAVHESDLVLIAGRESCVECHAPARYDKLAGRRVGGARHDCVECHDYHDRGGHASPWPLRTAAAEPKSKPAAATLRSRLIEFLTSAERPPGER